MLLVCTHTHFSVLHSLLLPPLQVSYSGIVQWTSNSGVFLQFPESGQLTTTNTNITISPLTPSTLYMFKVSVITAKGEGAEVMVDNTTATEVGGERHNSPSNSWINLDATSASIGIGEGFC